MKKIILNIALLICFTLSIFANETSNIEEKKERPKVGLILAGGGAKGFAHLPAIKAIEELGIPIDFVAGTSIGAIVGGFYACGYSPDEIFDLVNNIEWADFFMDKPQTPMESILSENSSESNLLKIGFNNKLSLSLDSGFSSGERIYQFFREKTIKYPSNIHFDELEIPFRAVTTNLLTGTEELIEYGDIAEVIRASMSIPGIFTPAQIGEKYYIDGGVTNNLPIEAAIDFGCDIIIALEISDDLETEITAFDSNYFVSVMQMYNMTQAPRNRPKYPLADFVFIPDLGDYHILSFKNGKEIWDLSEKALEAYMPELEKLRDKIFQYDYSPKSEERKTVYNEKDWITISALEVTNATEKEKKYISGLFQKIKNKPLTDKAYKEFVRDIYETGNYKSVNTRINKYENGNVLQVSLVSLNPSYGDVLLSGTYKGVLSAKETTKLLLTTDLQYRGLTGVNSVLSLKFGFVNGFLVKGLYIQPLTAKTFTKMEVGFLADRNFVTPNIQYLNAEGTALQKFHTSIGFGYRGSLDRLLYLNLDYSLFSPFGFSTKNVMGSENKYPESEEHSGISLNVKYAINTLDLPDFPKKGFLFSVKNQFLVPLGTVGVPKFCNFIEGNITKAFPLSKKISLIADFTAGTEYFQNIQKMPSMLPVYGLNLGSRLYSPQFASDYDYGSHKIQTLLSLQFDPWDDITIVGGKIYFSYFVGAENLWSNYEELATDFFDGIQWNTGLQIGVNIKKAFNCFVRGGISSYGEKVVPFISFDVGTLRL